MTEDMPEDLLEEPAPRGRRARRASVDRSNRMLLIVALLVLIATLAVALVVVVQVTSDRVPQTMTESLIADLETQISDDPENVLLYMRLADAYYGVQQYDEALEALDTVRSLEVTGTALAEAMYGSGRILDAKGDTEAAIAEYMSSLEVSELPHVRYSLASLYARQQQWDQAIEQYIRLLELQPTDAGAMRELAVAYEQAGYDGKALEMYQRAQTFLPDDVGLDEAVNRLEGRAQ